jgi:hypothetical protein
MKYNRGIFALCIAVGAALGVTTKNIGLWLPIGVALGVILGRKKH